MGDFDYGTPDTNVAGAGTLNSRQGMGLNSPGYTVNKKVAGSAITGAGQGLLSSIGGFATANPYLVIGGAIQIFSSVFSAMFSPEIELTPEQKRFERMTKHYRDLGKRTGLANGILRLYAPKAKPLKTADAWVKYEDTGGDLDGER